jgi:16S rRNA (guanine527-N7)-methyltransferase
MPDQPLTTALDSKLLRQAANALGIPLSDEAVAAFERYAAELVAWNGRLNLTRLVRPDEIAIQHFADSLVCLSGLPDQWGPTEVQRVVDVGSGAGLPGVALNLVRPTWSLTLVESVAKKAAFLRHLAMTLPLERVSVVCARAEEVGQDPAHRENHDLAVARAVAALPVLAEYLLPLLRTGGRMLAPKGDAIAAEVAAMAPALDVLGGRLVEVRPYRLPGIDDTRHLVIVEKTAPTPPAYPRRPGVPERRAIGGKG